MWFPAATVDIICVHTPQMITGKSKWKNKVKSSSDSGAKHPWVLLCGIDVWFNRGVCFCVAVYRHGSSWLGHLRHYSMQRKILLICQRSWANPVKSRIQVSLDIFFVSFSPLKSLFAHWVHVPGTIKGEETYSVKQDQNNSLHFLYPVYMLHTNL